MMQVKWIPQRKANEFIIDNHRHHGRFTGAIICLGLFVSGKMVGVATIGRPVSRRLDDGETVEVTRLCTVEIPNGCSKLYSSCSRIAKEIGMKKIVTYILESESGTSLKASGWIMEAEGAGGKAWNSSKGIKRTDSVVTLFGKEKKYPSELKQRWSKILL